MGSNYSNSGFTLCKTLNMSDSKIVSEKVGSAAAPKKSETKTPKKPEAKTPKGAETKTPKKAETKTPKIKETKSKKNTDVSDKKKPAVKKAETKKMTYLEMVIDVIAAMKDRTGSSRKAIVKRIVE